MTMESGEIEARFPLQDFAVHPIDADTVLVIYTSVVRFETGLYANRSSVWVCDSGMPRLRFYKATRGGP
jgi:hypothetical protein